MASDALRELLALFTIDVESDKLKEADAQINEFVATAKEAGKAILEAFAVHEVYEFVHAQIEAATELERTAIRIGTTTEELQALRLAAAEAGVSAESLNVAFRFLNRNMAEGSPQRAEFAKLGISLTDVAGQARPASDVMADLADKMAAMESPAKRTQIAMTLLGRGGAELIPLLSKGGEAFRAARKDLEELGGGMSENLIEKAKLAEAESAKLSVAFRSLKSDIAGELIPAFRWLTEGLSGFVKEVVDIERRSHVFKDTLALAPIALATAAVLKLVSAFRALAASELAAMALNPFTWMVIGIGVVILAFNDLKVALEGGKSIFKDFFGDSGIEALRTGILLAQDSWDILVMSFKEGWDVTKGLYNTLVASVALIGEAASKLATLLGFSDKAEKMFHSVRVQSGQNAVEDFGDVGGEAATAVASISERHANAALAANYTGSSPGYGFAPPIYATPVVGGAGASGASTTTIHNEYRTEVHAQGATDPKAVGSAVTSGLSTANERAMNNAMQAVRKP